jgi:hypothetical protein
LPDVTTFIHQIHFKDIINVQYILVLIGLLKSAEPSILLRILSSAPSKSPRARAFLFLQKWMWAISNGFYILNKVFDMFC